MRRHSGDRRSDSTAKELLLAEARDLLGGLLLAALVALLAIFVLMPTAGRYVHFPLPSERDAFQHPAHVELQGASSLAGATKEIDLASGAGPHVLSIRAAFTSDVELVVADGLAGKKKGTAHPASPRRPVTVGGGSGGSDRSPVLGTDDSGSPADAEATQASTAFQAPETASPAIAAPVPAQGDKAKGNGKGKKNGAGDAESDHEEQAAAESQSSEEDGQSADQGGADAAGDQVGGQSAGGQEAGEGQGQADTQGGSGNGNGNGNANGQNGTQGLGNGGQNNGNGGADNGVGTQDNPGQGTGQGEGNGQ